MASFPDMESFDASSLKKLDLKKGDMVIVKVPRGTPPLDVYELNHGIPELLHDIGWSSGEIGLLITADEYDITTMLEGFSDERLEQLGLQRKREQRGYEFL